jgi:amino acid transporter
MQFRQTAVRWWGGLVTFGVLLLFVGGVAAIAGAHSETVETADSIFSVMKHPGIAVTGVVIAILGTAVLAAGLSMLVIVSVTDTVAVNQMGREQRTMPMQTLAAQIATDPSPFEPHEQDAPVIAAVRRSLLLGQSPAKARSIAATYEEKGELEREQHAMVEALIMTRHQRGLGPLPPQF